MGKKEDIKILEKKIELLSEEANKVVEKNNKLIALL